MMIKEPKRTLSKVSKMIDNKYLYALLDQLQDDGFEIYANLIYRGVVAGGLNLADFIVCGKGRAIIIDNTKRGKTKQRRDIQILHKNEGWDHAIYIDNVKLNKETIMGIFTLPMREIVQKHNLPVIKNNHYRPFQKNLKDLKAKIKSSVWPYHNYEKLHVESKVKKARRSFIKLLR